MTEKHQTPETFFDVDDISSRLDQVIYDYKETLEKFDVTSTEEEAEIQRSAVNTLETIKLMNPRFNSEAEFVEKLNHAKTAGTLSEKAYRLIMAQTYY